jgi:ABC-type uncharacterized transport system substrate-binding protein
MIQRRQFITLVGGAAAWPLAARAQQPAMPVIGFLNGGSPAAFAELAASFRRGLQENGYVEDQNVLIEYRWAEGRYDQLPALAADLVNRRVAVIRAEIDAVFATLAERHAGGLVVQGDILFTNRRDDMVARAARQAIPAIYVWSEFTAAGGLIAYGNSLAEGYKQVGNYTARILRGAKPADLPVMQPSRFRFTINLKTAKTLGLTIPPSLLILADEVIE